MPIELRLQQRLGDYVTLEIVGNNMLDDPNVNAIVISCRDITTRRQAERDRNDVYRLLDHVFDNTPLGMAVCALDGRIVRVNHAITRMLGRSESELLTLSYQDLSDANELAVERTQIMQLLSGERESYRVEKRYVGSDGWARVALLTVSLLTDHLGEPKFFVGQLEDLTEREELRYRASHDPLTGLFNRSFVLECLSGSLRRARRDHPSQNLVALLFLDLDHFKLVNDSLGHEAGDELLVSVSERIVSIVPGDAVVARFGGDEFVVLWAGLGHLGDAEDLAHRLVSGIDDTYFVQGQPASIGVSIGIAAARAGEATPTGLIQQADAAVYRAKEQGRSRVEVFDDAVRARVDARVRAQIALRRAIDRGAVAPFYQPYILVSDGSLVGFEALVRLTDQSETITPGELVRVAEETGLIVPLGRVLFEMTCRDVARWQADAALRRVRVNVNLSAHQLMDRGFLQWFSDVIERTGVDPTSLCVEITETALAQSDTARVALQELKRLGLTLAIDDFGTGYSSLSRLSRYPFDVLKIDQSFVSEVTEDPQATIVAAMVVLAQGLDVLVCAEGVETVEQFGALHVLGVDYAQGYGVCEPLPVDEAEMLLAGRPLAGTIDVSAVLDEIRELELSSNSRVVDLRAAMALDGSARPPSRS